MKLNNWTIDKLKPGDMILWSHNDVVKMVGIWLPAADAILFKGKFYKKSQLRPGELDTHILYVCKKSYLNLLLVIPKRKSKVKSTLFKNIIKEGENYVEISL